MTTHDSGLPSRTTEPSPPAPQTTAPPTTKWDSCRVVSVRRWTDSLLSFCISRPAQLKFRPGHYARLGIDDGSGNIEWRPLSFVSSPSQPVLEFFAVLVPAGAFSNRLALLRQEDNVCVERTGFGFLTLDQLAPGNDLWLMASGTGLGPFISILRDGTVADTFEHIVVVHSVRRAAELAYREEIESVGAAWLQAGRKAKLAYIPAVTRELTAGCLNARIPELLESGRLQSVAGHDIDKDHSRVMVCGNPEMAKSLRAWLSSRDFHTARRGVPGQMAFEKYW